MVTRPAWNTGSLSSAREWRDEHGRLHRMYGPAIEYSDGTKEWWTVGTAYASRQATTP